MDLHNYIVDCWLIWLFKNLWNFETSKQTNIEYQNLAVCLLFKINWFFNGFLKLDFDAIGSIINEWFKLTLSRIWVLITSIREVFRTIKPAIFNLNTDMFFCCNQNVTTYDTSLGVTFWVVTKKSIL